MIGRRIEEDQIQTRSRELEKTKKTENYNTRERHKERETERERQRDGGKWWGEQYLGEKSASTWSAGAGRWGASERASTERAAAAHSGRAQRAVRRTKGTSDRSPRRKGTGHKKARLGRDRVTWAYYAHYHCCLTLNIYYEEKEKPGLLRNY
jgi:hypothetical protein